MANDGIRSQEWVDKIEGLVRQAESISDPNARRIAVELLEAVLEFHSAGLDRVMRIIDDFGPAASPIKEQITNDDLASSMLLLHDLHPDDLGTRVDHALQKLQEMFVSLGARLTLIGIESGTVRLQFDSVRTWSGAPVKSSVENAILQAAPEIERVIIEGLKEAPPANFVPLSEILSGSRV